MKIRIIASLITVIMVATLIFGCGNNAGDSHKGETVYGKVTSVDGDSIKFTVGTMNNAPANDEQQDATNKENITDNSENATKKSSGNETTKKEEASNQSDENQEIKGNFADSMIQLTDEELEVEVPDNITIYRTMGFGMNDANMPDQERPTGDEANTPPSDNNGQKEEVSDEKPTGDMPTGERPTGDMPSGDRPTGDGQQGGMNKDGQGETISTDQISEGDIIAVTFDENGDITNISVMSIGGMPSVN